MCVFPVNSCDPFYCLELIFHHCWWVDCLKSGGCVIRDVVICCFCFVVDGILSVFGRYISLISGWLVVWVVKNRALFEV